MKHIESSRLIKLTAAVEPAAIKYSLIERLRGAFHIETVGEGDERFTLTTLGRGTPYHCTLNVFLKTDGQRARVIIGGDVEINATTKIFYVLGLLALLILGLFPGTINTSGQGSAMDVLVFLFLGAFVLHDINKKLAEPEILLDRVLRAVETEFGT